VCTQFFCYDSPQGTVQDMLRPTCDKKVKGKGKSEHLYSALMVQTTLKRSDMDHTVLPANYTMPAFTS